MQILLSRPLILGNPAWAVHNTLSVHEKPLLQGLQRRMVLVVNVFDFYKLYFFALLLLYVT